ncbi:hypothetical protein CU098_011715 [Rhizopus stolonifer]|uniref:CTLH domain-containing protein n=1 Tax=Rhizopus stolonifer TaxID=4846 RepID=A0A367KYL2_RHIST|nr:hypothetical protein CU098_011715 [Rhizopus stolonifer]
MQITKPNSSKATTKSNSKSLSFLNNIKREELVRLMLQTLNDLEYPAVANFLQEESGIYLESDIVSHFRTSVLTGDWVLAENLMTGLPFIAHNLISKAQFLIRQQKFLELLEKNETMQALYVLRNEITPLGENTDRLHQLSSLVLCSSIEDIMVQAEWVGSQGGSRDQLLVELQSYIESSAMIPKHRLINLINQAMEWQKCQCLYHSPLKNNEFSLFSDHVCTREVFPSHTKKVLRGHTDEIWHVAYSNDGNYLASVSKDRSCIIWDMKTFEQKQLFRSEVSGSYCAWSPDDSKLLICGTDNAVRVWNPHDGVLEHTFVNHKDQVTSCVWLPDNSHFITGSCDKKLFLWSVENGGPLSRWPVQRTTDMKITKDGKRLVTIGLDKCITLYEVDSTKITEVGKVTEEGTITSLSITKNGEYALVNIQQLQEIHLWDLNNLKLVHKYSGQKQNEYIIRSTFGGADESFVLSGSEDNRVYIWNREHGTLLEALEGHENTVNCVSWCPTEPIQYVSAGDDHTIRV